MKPYRMLALVVVGLVFAGTMPAVGQQRALRKLDLKTLTTLLGTSAKSKEFGTFRQSVNELPKEVRSSGTSFTYFLWTKHGLVVEFNAGKVDFIFLAAEGFEGCNAYQGEMPLKLAFSDTRADVERKLGKPDRVDDGVGGILNVSTFYERQGIKISFLSKDPKDPTSKVEYIALFPAKASPAVSVQPNPPQKNLSADLVKQWRKLGAEYGRLVANPAIGLQFLPETGVSDSSNIASARLNTVVAGSEPSSIAVFRFNDISVDTLAKLPSPDAAFGLYLAGSPITDRGLALLASMPHLQVVVLAGCRRVTDKGLAELAKSQSVQSVFVAGDPITDSSVKTLAAIPNLKRLRLQHCLKVTPAGLCELGSAKRLQALQLVGAEVTDEIIGKLALLDDLQELQFSRGNALTEVGMKAIGSMTHLRLLDCRQCSWTDEGVKELGALKQLETLEIQNFDRVTDEGMKVLATLNKLKVLKIWDANRISDVGLKELVVLKDLQEFFLRCGPGAVSDGVLRSLASLRHLRSLELTECSQISDDGLAELAPLKNLSTLQLRGARRITDAGLKQLASLVGLESLELYDTNPFKVMLSGNPATSYGDKPSRELLLTTGCHSTEL